MSAACQLLAALHELSVNITLNGDRLHIKAPVGAITPDIKQSLTVYKAEVISLLEHRAHRPPSAHASVTVWHFLIDGKGITTIDREQLARDEMQRELDSKFGTGRVTNLHQMMGAKGKSV